MQLFESGFRRRLQLAIQAFLEFFGEDVHAWLLQNIEVIRSNMMDLDGFRRDRPIQGSRRCLLPCAWLSIEK